MPRVPAERHGHDTMPAAAPAATTMPAAAGAGGDAQVRRLLEIARDLAAELHPRRRQALRVGLDSSLERDLGLDSLSRVELLLRLEKAFQIHLGETILTEAETLDDLLAALRRAGPATGPGQATPTPPAEAPLVLEPLQAMPDAATTLLEMLEWHVTRHPDRPHLRLEEEGGGTILSFGALHDQARAVAGGLRRRGVESGDRIAIMLPTSIDFFAAFFGTLHAGAVPVPIYPPFRPAQLEDHLRRQAGILNNAEARLLIATAESQRIVALIKGQVPALKSIETVAALAAGGAPASGHPLAARPDPQDIALVQYTSGSTGDPKGVVLSHANLLANIRAMGEALQASSADVFVSWLPLYHDMGLIGAWLGSLYHGALLVVMSPLRFLARPANWLWAIHRHRATLSAAPNFAYELCLRKVGDAELEGLDLGSWRMAVNGAEPVSPATIRGFGQRFSAHGFHAEAMAPVYGLAECAVGLAFPPPGRGPVIDRVRRDALAETGFARPAPADDPTALEFVACGQALPGHQIRVIDAAGRELEERHEGRLQLRGPSATRGYWRNPEKTAALLDDGWLESGDLAYMVGGDVFLTGRSKDIVIRAGRNIYPHEVEETVGNLPGIRRGCVVAFGSHDPATGTERLIVVAETYERDPAARDGLRRQIDETVAALLETPAEDVVLAPPHAVVKTSSGKIRRAACRTLYEQGRIGERQVPLWWQVARLQVAGLWARAARLYARAGAVAYGGYWWGLLCLLAGLVWPLVMLLPTRRSRWRLVNRAARAFLRYSSTALSVEGLETLPAGGAVLAVNHASYFDNVVLAALLDRPPVFIAKRELEGQFFAGRFLRRIGAVFVERFDPGEALRSAGAVLAAARRGDLLVFYPEGTLGRSPGLLPFHMGAFRTAVELDLPLVPVALRGTRSILRGGQWFPRRGAVQVALGAPLQPAGKDWAAAVTLRDAARAELLRATGEPDLPSAPAP